MKKEVLSIRNFKMKYNNLVNMDNISLSLIEGESTGFLGLANSGKDALIHVLYGDQWPSYGEIFVDDNLIRDAQIISKWLHRIIEINYAITDWTVEEYIGLVTDSFKPMVLNEKELRRNIKQLFKKLDLDINTNQKIGELTELEKRLVDLAKAYYNNARILVIQDVFEGITIKDIHYFKTVMNHVIKDKMTVVVDTNSDNVNEILSDNFIIFRKGQIVKKCKKQHIKDRIQLEAIFLGTTYSNRKESIESHSVKNGSNAKPIYTVKNFKLNDGKEVTFRFGESEVVTLLAQKRKDKLRLFNILSGREVERGVELYLNQKRCRFGDISDFVKNRIISGMQLGSEYEIFPRMSIGENIAMPSLGKISTVNFISDGSKMIKMLQKRTFDNSMASEQITKEKETNDRILILLERWHVFKPKVLILLEPFIQCDVYGVYLIKSYIRKYIAMGTSVIIIKSREDDIEDISNRIISIET